MKRIALANFPHPDKGLSYSLGLGYLTSALIKRGREVFLLDEPCFTYKDGAARLLKKIRGARPDLIGIALPLSLNVSWGYEFLKLVKRTMPSVPVVAGGLHSTLLPGEVINAGFDYAVLGDGEYTFIGLLESLEKGEPPEKLKGIAMPGGERRIVSTGPAWIDDLDSVPFPANRFYEDVIEGRKEKFLILILSRGCVRSCAFCVERHLNRGVRYRSAANVMEEIDDAWERHQIKRLHFLDSSFLENRERVKSLCERLSAIPGGRRPEWKCAARADHLDPDLLGLMKAAGCNDIYIGFESANDDTLEKIRKNVRSSENERAIALCREAGITPTGYMIVGFPWETADHFAKNREFIDRHKTDAVFLCFVPAPFPGTSLYEDYHAEYGFTEWWLQEKWRPANMPGRPLFLWLRCFDQFLERNFFRYDDETWTALCGFVIKTRFSGSRSGLKNLIQRVVLKLMDYASVTLERTSARLEHAVMPPIYRVFDRAARRLRKTPLSAGPLSDPEAAPGGMDAAAFAENIGTSNL